MKKIYSVAIMCLLITSTSVAQVQSDCETTPELAWHYRKDVADLAINRMFATSSPDTNQIEIPQIYMDSVWNGLSAIFNAISIPERDSIFDIYCIHNRSSYTEMLIPCIYVSVDTSVSWTSNWLNGEILTGYQELDEFISTYNYYLISPNPKYTFVIICSDSIINSFAVSDSLTTFTGIESAGPIPMTIDGNRILYDIQGDYQYFTFTLAWMDCFNGCARRYSWNFKVNYYDCSVFYLGFETNTNYNLPDPINCDITLTDEIEIDPAEFLISPNPAIDKISIEGQEIQKIDLLNSLGQMIYSVKPFSNKITINTIDLKPGIYFIKIYIKDSLISRKVIVK